MKNQIEGTGAGEKFNAVRESRKWKAAVVAETAGMTREEVLAYFNAAREQYIAERRAWERKHAPQRIRTHASLSK